MANVKVPMLAAVLVLFGGDGKLTVGSLVWS